MDPEHARLIRESWALAIQHADVLSDHFYAALFARHPRAAAMFAGVDMRAQRRKFVDTLDALVSVTDDPAHVVSEIIPSGRRHAGYGVTAEDFDDARAVFLDALEERLGARFDAATRDAWRELWTLVAAVMVRAGTRPSGAVQAV